jgi:hypothetical protein
MTSHTRAMRTLTLWSFAAAMMWFAGTALARNLHAEALVKALQKGGRRSDLAKLRAVIKT